MPYDDTPRNYQIIVQVDSGQRILEYSCHEFVDSLDGWVETSEAVFGNIGHAHHQIVILTQNARDEQGIPLYKLADGSIAERSSEEIEADIAALPPVKPDEVTLLRAQLLSTQDAVASLYEMLIGG